MHPRPDRRGPAPSRIALSLLAGLLLGALPLVAQTADASPAAATPAANADVDATVAAIDQLTEQAWDLILRVDPLFADATGRHPYRDQLPVRDEATIHRGATRQAALLGRLQTLLGDEAARAALPPETLDDAAILGRRLADAINDVRHKRHLFPITNRDGFHIALARLPSLSPFATLEDYRAYLTRLGQLGNYVDQNIALMRAGLASGHTQPRVVLEGFDESIRTHVVDDPEDSVFYRPFVKMPTAFAGDVQDRLRIAGRTLIADQVVPAYRRFLDFFVDEYRPGARETIGTSALPNGADAYAHLVRHYTTLDVTARAVHDIGLAEVARIRAEMDTVIARARAEDPTLPPEAGKSFAAFVDFLRTDPRFYADTPAALVREAAWISKRMDGALPQLFGAIPRQPYGLSIIPADIAAKTTAAYYQPAPPDSTRAGQYFLNVHDLRSRPLYALEALSLHEAVPGHHFQIARQGELKGLSDLRRFTFFGAYVEGWALYAERLGLEAGFYQDPYSDFGRLTYEIWRACRLVVDTGIHALGWSRQQAIDYLAGNTALSLHEVTTEIDRYIAWPGQALGYKMGELEIRRLRREAEDALGTSFDLRAFHDAILGAGAVPMDVLARRMTAWIDDRRPAPGSAAAEAARTQARGDG
ncbi:MAG: DUF885 domain-containing protein [Acidobacteriota bacterium]